MSKDATDATDGKVVSIYGGPALREPNGGVVAVLEDLLERAKAGEIANFVMTGFTSDGLRMSANAGDTVSDVYAMAGALAWLQREYMERIAGMYEALGEPDGA